MRWRTGTVKHVDPCSYAAYNRQHGFRSACSSGGRGRCRCSRRTSWPRRSRVPTPAARSRVRVRLRRAIPLNLAISFVAVVVAACSRWLLAGQAPLASVAPVAIAMMIGGMFGALVGSHWLARVSDARLHTAVRVLLVGIGALLIAEALSSWTSSGLPFDRGTLAVVASCFGVGIGGVSTLLGVAGGELIIPTLVLAFGVPIKAAGTMSLLISVPTMLVGLWWHRSRGSFQGTRAISRIVLPMAGGTVVSSTVGGLLVAYAPAAVVKLLLGCVLIGSALRVFKMQNPEATSTGSSSVP